MGGLRWAWPCQTFSNLPKNYKMIIYNSYYAIVKMYYSGIVILDSLFLALNLVITYFINIIYRYFIIVEIFSNFILINYFPKKKMFLLTL